ncbi:MAG: CotH kinase family protein [Lachnospiraceae bacterium]|nr:CotH kinase family protein [Lachnospiraceae bacterium]
MTKQRTIFSGVLISLCLSLAACGKTDGVEEIVEEIVTEPAAVAFSKESGCYEEAFVLTIETLEECSIYYTLDGSDPESSASRQVYTEEGISIADRSGEDNVVSAVPPALFDTAYVKANNQTKQLDSTLKVPGKEDVDKCTVVRVAAYGKDGSLQGTIAGTYFIGSIEEHVEGVSESALAAGQPLSIISITMNYEDLFDPETGIYVRGNIFDEALQKYIASGQPFKDDCGRKLEANYNQRGREWERTAHVDFLESDGMQTKCVLSQDCGIRIQGNFSRSDLQKGFRLYAREDYGNKRFDYPIFGDGLKNDAGEVIDSFKTLTLRNGGNCAFTTKFSDTYWQSMLGEVNCETLTSRPAVVYINGEYWGLYVLQEDYSAAYFEDTHLVDSDNVAVYKGDAERLALGYKLDVGKLPEGETLETYFLFDVLTFFRTHKDLKSQEDYEAFCELVDPDSVRDYFAVETWINNKWDWPGKNWSMWRTIEPEEGNPYGDCRWRLMFYDLEFGGVSGRSDAFTNTIKEDNYKPHGLLDMDTNNPAVLMFAYLMTNEEFRKGYENRLWELSDGVFAYENAKKTLDQFVDTYSPLYPQFFARYQNVGSADGAVKGGYASAKCIDDFLQERANNIQKLIDYAEKIEGE